MDNEPGPGPDAPADEGLDAADRRRVLDAAITIFGGYGPASVTLKWVALASGVDVVHLSAEWPTVDSLLASVLDDLASAVEAVGMAELRLAPADQAERGRLIELYERVVARSLLDGVNPAELQKTFESTEHLVEIYQSVLGLDERSARYRVCQSCALEWGWRLFGPHLTVACGLDGEPPGQPFEQLQNLHAAILKLPPLPPA